MKLKRITKLTGPQKILKSRGITVRLPEDIISEIEKLSLITYQSISSIVRSQLIKLVRWDVFQKEINLVPIPVEMMNILIKNNSNKDLEELASKMFITLKEWTILTKKGWGLNQCIESLEDYLKISGIDSSHKKRLDEHIFEVKHNMDDKWSIFGKYLLHCVFKEFSNKEIKFEISPGIFKASIELGQEFDEHEY